MEQKPEDKKKVKEKPRETFTRKQQLARLIEKNPAIGRMVEALNLRLEL